MRFWRTATEIRNDLARIEARIAEIAGGPPAPPADFGALVNAVTSPALRAADADRLIGPAAAAWNVDPSLVKAVIANESGFDANATSPAGAIGLMQLMPATAASLGVSNPYDPAQNVWAGTRYLRGLLDRFGGQTALALAAYNAGAAAVEKYRGVPPYAQTQTYVARVLASCKIYARQR